MKDKLKLIAGCIGILLLSSAGVTMYAMNHGQIGQMKDMVRAVVLPVEKVGQTVQQKTETVSVSYVGDDFSLPPADADRPVYDRYPTRERQAKGLPVAPPSRPEYFYGDHVVYLTFDDGPNQANTEKIMNILKQENIRATFFLTGQNVERYPDVVRQLYQSGNAIGIHSYSHDYDKLYASPQAYVGELLKTEELIYHVIGVRPVISRAPGGTAGHFTKAYWQAIGDIGYVDVGWNSLTGDADGTGKTAAQAVKNLRDQLQKRPYLHSHLIVLMHDAAGHEATVEALPEIIRLLKEQGYSFRVVTPSTPPAW